MKVAAADVLDAEEKSEVVEGFGGPCRGRTHGPLVKKESGNRQASFHKSIHLTPFIASGLW